MDGPIQTLYFRRITPGGAVSDLEIVLNVEAKYQAALW